MTKLDILYEDNHIIVVFKPAGILSQADKSGDVDMITIIKSYLKEKYPKSTGREYYSKDYLNKVKEEYQKYHPREHK